MYTSIPKAQAFPLASKFSSQPRCLNSTLSLKLQTLHLTSHQKPFQNPNLKKPSCRYGSLCLMNLVNSVTQLQHGTLEMGRMLKFGRRYCRGRSFSSSYAEKKLPWLVSSEHKEHRVVEKAKTSKVSRSFQKGSVKKEVSGTSKSSWEESIEKLEKAKSEFFSKPASSAPGVTISAAASTGRKNCLVERVRERSDYGRKYEKYGDNDEVGDEEEEMAEVVDDPRWDKIKNRFKGIGGEKVGPEKHEFRRWDRQENWGTKTWKEATESTVPKIVGEGIYGVGPVLAALSAGRREFYALYVQEGLDLSSNNRKKKDKKGFEKVLKIAEKVGLSVKEASKHDLNMVVDNRPHQGLVLDASPLEMVKIMELEPVSIEEGKGSLWLALDEVTDPQNLGAIIRSAYYFGASGIVLCAKNSARLSGVVSKASAGSLELMELRYCKNMMQFLVSSAENGWRVLGGSVSSKSISLDEVVPGAPTILVLGSEGTGLRPLVERSCTQLVRIPGSIPSEVNTSEFDSESTGLRCESSGTEFLSFSAVESLNVSVAAGVLIHHLIGKNSAKSSPEEYRQTNATE